MMNYGIKNIGKKLNLVSGFRKIISYVLIFSLLWQNSLWATNGLTALEEDLGGSRVRTYNGRRAAVVEPGTIRDTEIHNVFADLQLLKEGGIVFTGAPNTTKIYNRIYSADPIQLSGVIEADYPLPMVFANPGGIILENPDFQNIHDLTLAAGPLAQTNEGMAYGVEDGSLFINKTFVQEKNDVKNLSLAARAIQIQQSFLSPAETLILRAGQHIKGWNKDGEWISEDSLESNKFSLSDHCSIFLDDSTILRSKGLFFESLDEGTSIHANGLLQSTNEDITIFAKGNVYLDKIFATKNLHIETTGKVFFRNKAAVGGSIHINARGGIEIDREGDILSGGAIHFANEIGKVINRGRMISHGGMKFDSHDANNDGILVTQGLLNTKNGFVNGAFARLHATSLSNPLALLSGNSGYVEIQDDLKLNCKKDTLKGTIKTHGKIEVSGQELTLDGNVSAQNGFVFKGLTKLTNGVNSTLSALGNGLQGTLDTLINEGKMMLSFASATIGKFTNKGSSSSLTGNLAGTIDALINEGKMELSSATGKIGKLTNTQGSLFSVFGSGFQGAIDTLENQGKMDFASVNITIKNEIKNTETGVIRTAGHFIVQEGNSQAARFYNHGKIFTCGIHQIKLTGTYKDNGTLYVPTLLLLDAKSIEYTDKHKSYLKDGLIRATSSLHAGGNVCFDLNGNTKSCFLQLSSQGQLNYNGKIQQWSSQAAQYPLLDYYKIFGQEPALSYKDFSDKIHDLSSGRCAEIKKSFPSSGVTLQAKTLHCSNTWIKQDNGSIYIDAENYFADGVQQSAGYFTKNNVNIKCQKADLNQTKIDAPFGHLSLIAKESAQLKDSIFKGLLEVNIASGNNLGMDNCRSKSSQRSVNIDGGKNGFTDLNDSSYDGNSGVHFSGDNLKFNRNKAETKNGLITFQSNSAEINHSDIKAPSLSALIQKDLFVNSSSFKATEGAVHFQAGTGNINNSPISAQSTASLMADYLEFHDSSLTSVQGSAQVEIKKTAAINNSQVAGEKDTRLSASDLIMKKSHVVSRKEATRVNGTNSVESEDCKILGHLLAAVTGETVAFRSSTLKSTEDSAYLAATELAKITDSKIIARALATLTGKDLLIDSSSATSREDAVRLQATHLAKITNSDLLSRYLVGVSGKDVIFGSSSLRSEKDAAHLHATNAATVKNSDILGKLLVSVSGQDVSMNNGTLTSQEDAVHVQGQKSATITGSKILSHFLTSVMGKDIAIDSSHLNSQKGGIHVQGTDSATITGSTILAKLLAFVGADDVAIHSSTVISQKEKARIEAKNSARIAASVILARSLASVIGKEVTIHSSTLESQEDVVLIAASKLANIIQSTLKGKEIGVDGGENLTFSDNKFQSQHNHFKADNINAGSNKIDGKTSFEAKEKLSLDNNQLNGSVSALAQNINVSGKNTAHSLEARGNSIQIEGSLFVEKFLTLMGDTIAQLGTTKAGENTYMQASKSYIDNAQSRNEAAGSLFIYADKTEGFKGDQKAGDTLEVTLKDMNLFDFLSQTEARLTKAHLKEAEISFKDDFILDRTLHLWGKSLENKAKFTATKDFIAHMQDLIMNEGSMVVQGNMSLESQGAIGNVGHMEAKNLNVKGKTVVNESLAERKTISGGFRDELKSQATMRANGGNLNVEATELLQARGAKFEAKLNLSLKSAGALYLGTQQLASDYAKSSKRSKYHRSTLNNHKTEVNAGQNVNIESGEGMIFEGLSVRAGGCIHAKAGGNLEVISVHDKFQKESHYKSRNKKKDSQTTNDTVVRNIFKAGGDVTHESVGTNTQQATRIECDGKATITSHQGKVIIKADKSSKMASTNRSSKNLVWQKQQQKGRYDETVEMLEILATGGIHISAAQGIETEIGKNVNPSASYEWIQALREDSTVAWHLIGEEHKKWNQKVQGLTGPATAVIAIAIAIATAGAGSGAILAGLAATSVEGAMASAAFTSLVTQTTLSMINNQGDMGKVLKSLVSKEYLKSLATSVVTAGATQGLCNHFKIPSQPSTFAEHLQNNAAKYFVNSGSSIVRGDKPLEALKAGLINTVMDSVAAMGATKIGDAYGNGAGDANLNWGTHKLLHGILGAGMSAGKAALFHENPEKAALAGGVGAMFAEAFAEATRGVLGTKKAADVAIVATGALALATNQKVDVAVSSATNAIANNFKAHAKPDEEEDEIDGEDAENMSDIIRISYGKKIAGGGNIADQGQSEGDAKQKDDLHKLTRKSNFRYRMLDAQKQALEEMDQICSFEYDSNASFCSNVLSYASSGMKTAVYSDERKGLASAYKIGLAIEGASIGLDYINEKPINQERWNHFEDDIYYVSTHRNSSSIRGSGSKPQNSVNQLASKQHANKNKSNISTPKNNGSINIKTSVVKTPPSGQATAHPVIENRSKVVNPKEIGANQKNFNAKTPMASEALGRKLSALESAQENAKITKSLPDGRIRYYDELRPAKKEGPTAGSRYVLEHNPQTGQVRDWNECYAKEGTVNRVHPKMIDGNTLNAPHYPLTGKELGKDKK